MVKYKKMAFPIFSTEKKWVKTFFDECLFGPASLASTKWFSFWVMKMARVSHINQTLCYKMNDQNFSSERSTEENTEEKETKMREEEKREKMKMSKELTVSASIILSSQNECIVGTQNTWKISYAVQMFWCQLVSILVIYVFLLLQTFSPQLGWRGTSEHKKRQELARLLRNRHSNNNDNISGFILMIIETKNNKAQFLLLI